MGTIKSILREENERLEKLKKRYEKDIAKLPAGVISIKTRGNKRYAYIAYREKEKIKTDYLGPAESKKVQEIENKIQKRKEIQSLLKTTKERIREVQRVINGKKI